MIGPLLLAISWLLLRLEGKSLDALGFNTPGRRTQQFLVGFVIAALAVVVQQIGLSLAAGIPWQMNPEVNLPAVVNSIRWNLNSVLYEELLFRGYLLYQAMRWLGPRSAVLLDAAVFGVYHWFSYGAFGNPAQMVFVFLFTGAFGFMLAVAFVKTQSIFAPLGLHLGWNLISYLVFSAGPLGRELLIPANGAPRMEAAGISDFLFDVGVPLALIVGVSWLLLRRRSNDSLESNMPSRIRQDHLGQNH